MKVIIEWCDWTWKTYLSNYISNKTWMPILKFWHHNSKNYIKDFNRYYKINNIILDRSWLSEIIYSKIKKRNTTLKNIEKMISLTWEFIYIICTTDIDNINKVFNERWEDFIDINEAILINKEYLEFIEKYKYKLNIIVYDYTKDWNNLENLLILLKNKKWITQ